MSLRNSRKSLGAYYQYTRMRKSFCIRPGYLYVSSGKSSIHTSAVASPGFLPPSSLRLYRKTAVNGKAKTGRKRTQEKLMREHRKQGQDKII